MSLARNVDSADQQMSIADQDPPSIPVGVPPARASQDHRGNQQLVQWLSVQADHMAGTLQQNVRALMVRASSPVPPSERQQDEVARLRAQLQHSKKVNGDMRALLQNQALAIEQFQNRWHMAGQEAHAFVARTRSESEDFVRAEFGAIERFEDRVQRQYSGELQQHVHALQDQCRDHVGQEESKLRKELTHALTHESQVFKDNENVSLQEMEQLRGLVVAQREELRSMHVDCAEIQRRSASTEAELQRRSTHEEHALYQRFDDMIKEKDAQVHALQHEISRLHEKQRVQLEAECFEAERRAASTPVFAEGSSTVRFATPVEKIATVADFHSPDMSLGASAGNLNLKTRTAGQTMVINARRRLGMKTTPQPVETAAKAEAKAVSRPTRRMRAKGPLQTDDFQKAPNPGGDPPYDHAGNGQPEDQDARGSGGVHSPPGLPVRLNPGGPPGDSGDDHGGGGGHDESDGDTPVDSDDGTGFPRKPDGDPEPDDHRGKHSRMYQTMTINKWAKPIPKLDLPPRIHTQKASKIKQIWETWCVQVALALSTWNSLAVPYWSDIYGRAERDYEKWRKSTMTARYKHETRFLYGRKAPIPPNCDAIEALLRLELLTQFPNWLSQKATMLGCTSSHDILKMALKEIFPNEDATRFDLVEELYSLPQKPPSTMHTFAAWLEDWVTKLVAADEISAYVEPRRAMAVLSHVGKPLQAQDTLFMTEWVAIFRESGLRDDVSVDNLREACLQLVVCARARARELQVDVQVERASRAVVTANTGIPTKGKSKPAMESAVCKFFLTADGCKFGDECKFKHPRTNGKCLRCGAEGHSLSSCTRPSKAKPGSQPKQSTKGKGRSSQTPTSSKPSSDAKAKAQPKEGAKGKGKGKKDKSSNKPSAKSSTTPSTKSSAKSSTKTSAKSGEVSFDNDDAEEEAQDEEYEWGEEDAEQVEEEHLEYVEHEDQAFATPYHSHVGAVNDTDGDTVPPLHSITSDGEASETPWIKDDATDVSGMTRIPQDPQERQPEGPSASARIAAEAVMNTTFPTMLAEMNPEWAPLTAQDLLDHADRSSDSAELITSEDEPEDDGHSTTSEDGYPNLQRVVTYPAQLTEEGGVERIGPVEIMSDRDPHWNQWDEDQWFAYHSGSDYKERACAYTAASSSIPASTKDSWEWRGSCCLVRVHRQARRCLFTPTWKEDIWQGFTVFPTRKTYVTPVGQKKHLNPVIENVKHCSSLKPRRVAYSWTGETHFKVDPDMSGKRVFRMSARILVPANDMNPVAIADSGASHVILPTSALPEKKTGKKVTLRLAAGQVQAVEHQREIFADHVTVPLCPLGRVIRKLGLTAIWTPQSLTLTCVNSAGTAHGLMQCPVKGDTPYFTSVQFWMLRRALQAHRQGQKTFPPSYWKQLYTTAIREGPALCMAKSTEATKTSKPDMKKCSLPQLGSYLAKTLLSQGLRQMVEQSRTRVSVEPISTYVPITSCVLGLDPPHSVVNVDANRQEWLQLLHLLASHRPTHLQHPYTTILLQTGDFMPIQKIPNMWEKATMIMLGKYRNGEIWTEGSGTTPCPSTCLSDKYKVTDGYLIPADNQFVDLNLLQKYAIVPAKGDRIVVTYVLLKSEHIASYQHALLTKHEFPVTPFAYPVRKRLVKKGPDPSEESLDMKQLRLLGEHLTDKPVSSTRSPEEWEQHERNGHYPKLPDCPVCTEEQGPVVRHHAYGSTSLNTLHLDTGYWGDWSLDEKRYFIAAALRVQHDGSGILIPFFIPIENKSAIIVSKEVFALVDWISNCKQIQAFQGAKITRILSDQGTEFVNQEFENHARLRGIHLCTSPAYQPQSNGVAERMVGLAKQCARRLLLASRLPDIYWSYAMRFAAEMLRHKALGFPWNLPAFGEEVGIWRSQDKKLIKSAQNRGAIGRLIEVTPWQNGTTSLIAKGSDLQDPEIIYGLQPKTVAVECLRLAAPRTIPSGWTKPALDVLARQWTSIRTPEGKDLWIQLTTGKAQYSSPFVSEVIEAKPADTFAYWGDVTEEGNDHVRQEVLDFVRPAQQPEQLRTSLTKTVPKARIVPNKVVMQTQGDQYERWKQATAKELHAFLKTAWKEPTAETKARYFAKKQKVVMQLLVFTMKPMTAEKRALGLQGDEYEKARICLQGQHHEGFQIHNSTNNADAHLLRLFLSVYASSKNVLASFDVSNAFLNAELSEEVTILTQPAPELIQFGLVKPGTLYQCTKACYGLREAPKLWEESRDKTLTAFHFLIDGDTYSLRQSVYHPSLWFVVRAPCLTRPQTVRLPDESDLPDLAAFGECVHVAAILVYVDDFLAVGPRHVLQALLTQLLQVWKGSNPDFLGREPGDIDTLRFLGLDIELGEQEGTWLVHQQSYIHAFLQEMFGEYLKDRRTPGEADSYSNKPEHHAQKARVKHPVLRPDQDPLEHTPILRLVGVLLWVSLRTRPDISWAVARITRLASSDEPRARVCVKHVAQYLKWTLHFALFYEPVTDCKWHCYTDASWSPEGDYSHQAVAIYYDTNLVAWQSQRQSLVALSSAEAELIASVWGNRLALSLYGQLMEMILAKPTYITYCDNAAVVQLTQQLSASKTRTRHLSMRASWLHHLVQRENVSMQFVPTSYQKADILTKGLQAYSHELAREGLRLRLCNGL